MNKEILRIAIPAIVANITVPLLGLIDLTIAGHLGRTECIGAIAVGSTMFSIIYTNFNFLRMGTSGITAQAFGAKNMPEASLTLLRSTLLALLIGLAIILLQYPLQGIVLLAIGPSNEVLQLVQSYFFICVWGAPPILMMMAVKGWFLGMQDAKSPMIISIFVNVANIITSLIAVYLLDLGFTGIALGTLIAEYAGLALSFYLVAHKHRNILKNIKIADTLKRGTLGKFFTVNRDIFLRSVCLMTVTLSFTAIGARSGDVILAANAIMIQLFLLISYFSDGFAFAGEALVGRFYGARDYSEMRRCIRWLFVWGTGIMLVFAVIYGFFSTPIFSILTDDTTVISTAEQYRWWCVAIPIAGMASFVWDGIFIGMTATRGMLLSILASCATFYLINFIPVYEMSNNRLWTAFISYLALRGLFQTFYYHFRLRKTDSKCAT